MLGLFKDGVLEDWQFPADEVIPPPDCPNDVECRDCARKYVCPYSLALDKDWD